MSGAAAPTEGGAVDNNPDAAWWPDALPAHAGAEHQFARLPFDHPLYFMSSSGTTGLPKCMVHGAGGTLIQHLKELVLHTDLQRDDRIFYFTTCGWMMWNWLVSSLAVGSTVVLYDGAPVLRGKPILWDMPSGRVSPCSERARSGWPWSRRRAVSRRTDRKSTRLNSSHTVISYAVFCLKKKKKEPNNAFNIARQPSLGSNTKVKLELLGINASAMRYV